ncbi:MAG: glycine betaine/L-proline ABC transporter substrate-binding protein ProX [Mesorhizobium sp.]|nr:glycine betaine/L-proline ABC transporter substrate-binding protein ProX [Mesorhizobium sp.]
MASFKHSVACAFISFLAVSGVNSAVYAEDLGVVRPADDGLLEGLFQTEIVNIGLEKLGYKVAPVSHLDIPSMTLAVGQGDADFTAVHWEPLQNSYFDKAGGTDTMTRLGSLVAGAGQGYLVDKATAEKYGIKNVEQLKDPAIAKIFDTDGDGKADLAGCPPGWGCEKVIEHQMDAYDLRKTVTHNQGQFMVMAADVVSRFKAGEPVLYYTYTPLWVSQVLRPGKEVEWLEVPFTALPDDAKGNTSLPDGRNVGFSVNNIRIIANNKFLEANPIAKRWFELVTVPIEEVNKENLQINDGEKSAKDIRGHAETWIAANQAQFDGWIEEARAAK